MSFFVKQKFFIFILIFLFCSLIFSSALFKVSRKPSNYDAGTFTIEELNRTALEYISEMSAEDAVSQIFLVNIAGDRRYVPVETYADIYPENKEEAQELRQKTLLPGGCLFFSYNVSSDIIQLMEYIESIHKVYSDRNLPLAHIAVDQEGGVVNRLRAVTSPFPSNQRVAEEVSPSQAEELYLSQAKQMKMLGFTMNLSPVAEPSGSENSQFLLTRSFGDPAKTVAFCVAQINAFEKTGLCSVVKHFPGNTNADPHTGLAEIKVSPSVFEQYYLKPFKLILTTTPGAVLMSHAKVLNFPCEEPAALSSYWIKEKLKKEFYYQGLVISDDIFMAALSKNGFPPEEAVVKAIESGTDIIMLSEKRFASALRVLLDRAKEDENFNKLLLEAEKKVIVSKIYYGLLELYREDGKIKVRNKNTSSDIDVRLSNFKKEVSKGFDIYCKYF